MRENKRWYVPAAVAGLIFSMLLTAFVACYCWTCDTYHSSWVMDGKEFPQVIRRYPDRWQRIIFSPFGRLESIVRRINVYIEAADEPDDDVIEGTATESKE